MSVGKTIARRGGRSFDNEDGDVLDRSAASAVEKKQSRSSSISVSSEDFGLERSDTRHSLSEAMVLGADGVSRKDFNFGTVMPQVYRSACPEREDHAVLHPLRLKTVLSLADKERPDHYMQFMKDNGINHVVINMEGTKKAAISLAKMSEILAVVLDSSYYPLLIHCNHGRHRTGCVVAVVHKIQGMATDSILDEYRSFAGGKPRDVDIEYIRAFDIDAVEHVVGRVGVVVAEHVHGGFRSVFRRPRVQQLMAVCVVVLVWIVTLRRL